MAQLSPAYSTKGEKAPLGVRFARSFRKYWPYYVMLIPAVLYFVIFCYGPMYGIQIAFKDFKIKKGFGGSAWADPWFKYFVQFFESYYAWNIIRNTLVISIYSLIAGFPFPIILALSMDEMRHEKVKKAVQTITYAPNFISTVVICGMILSFTNQEGGLINNFIQKLGGEPIAFMYKENLFPHIYVWTGIWQGMGWSSVIYFAALSGINPQLLEAATLDGASRFQKVIHVKLPTILPIVVIQLILNAGSLLNVGYEKVYLLQNSLNLNTSEVISTYVYKRGMVDAQYSFSTAVGLAQSIVSFVMVFLVNTLASKISETSLF